MNFLHVAEDITQSIGEDVWVADAFTFTATSTSFVLAVGTPLEANVSGTSTMFVFVDGFAIETLCSAGTAIPHLDAMTISNTCPTTTTDLNAIGLRSPAPAGLNLTWHTGTPATSANKLTPAEVAARPAGTYYASFFDSIIDCYSDSGNATAPVTVTITGCCPAGYDSPLF